MNNWRSLNWYELYHADNPSPYILRQLKQFKKDPQSFIGHPRKLINICTLKHDVRFLRKYKDYLDWSVISARQKLSQNTIEEFADYVNWEKIFYNQRLSTKFLRRHIDKLTDQLWSTISTFQKLDKQFLRDFKDKVNWGNVCINQTFISERFFEEKEIKPYIDMNCLTQRHLSEKFIRKHINEFNKDCWNNICGFNSLSNGFIDQFADKVNWETVSANQNLSIKLAQKYKDKIDWNGVGYHVFLTPVFMRHFKYRLNWAILSMRQIWDDDTLREFADYIQINHFVFNPRPLPCVSESCLREFFMQAKNPSQFLNLNKKFSQDFVREIWDGK